MRTRPVKKASRNRKRNRKRKEFLGAGLLFSFTALALGLVLRWFLSRGVFDIREVRIVGTRFSDPVELLDVTAPELGDNIFADHREAVRTLQRMPLIKKVDVDRIPPDRIVINVVEREPVAMLNGETILPVDDEGWLLPVSASDYDLDLPIINITDTHDIDAVGRVDSRSILIALDFLKTLRENEMPFPDDISVLSIEKEGGIRLSTNRDDCVIYLNSDVTVEDLCLLSEVRKNLDWKETGSHSIDMRYKDQVVVF